VDFLDHGVILCIIGIIYTRVLTELVSRCFRYIYSLFSCLVLHVLLTYRSPRAVSLGFPSFFLSRVMS